MASSNQASLTPPLVLGVGLLDVPRLQPGATPPRTAPENLCQTGPFGLPLDGYYTHCVLFVNTIFSKLIADHFFQ